MREAKFEVESYLAHAAKKFAPSYDANCYLLLSRAMDLMDITKVLQYSHADGSWNREHAAEEGEVRAPAG